MTRPPARPTRDLLRLLVRAAPGGSAALAALVVVRSVLPVAYMLGVGALVEATRDGATAAVRAVALLAVLMVAQELADTAQGLLADSVGRELTRHTSATILDGVLRPIGITHMERPGVADEIALAQGLGAGALPPGAAVPALAELAVARLAGVAAAVTLARYCWWAPLPLAAAWLIAGRWLDREVRGAVRGFAADTPALRKAAYVRQVGLTPPAAKETRIFGLAGWLVLRYTAAWRDGMREMLAYRQPTAALFARLGLVTAAHLAALGALGFAAAGGSLGVGALTVAVQAVLGIATLGYVGDAQWRLAHATGPVPHVLAVRDLAADDPMRGGHRDAAGLPRTGIRFHRVGFGYPDRPGRVLDRLDLTIPAGRSLAVVGVNGAGKTTLLKILARLYDPDEGSVTVDGVDLREFDPATWRRQLAVVFQDFTRYEVSLRENVGFGAPAHVADDEGVVEALRLAGAASLVDALPHGLDTVLSRQFTDGADLSGGQWQKVALARAMFAVRHGARVLVLDEPTAHLDVRSESRLYRRFLDLTAGTTTVLVSHRFSTVRLADRICVVRDGRVSESGSHDELMDAGGEYARMFTLQAARFLDGARA